MRLSIQRITQGIAMSALIASQSVSGAAPVLQRADIQAVSPALDHHVQDTLLGGVWKRPGLSARDRGLVTVAALIARQQTIEMRFYMNLALDSGVTPRELSETILQLAFYSGFPNAMAAVAVAKDVFADRKIGLDQLPVVSPDLLPIDQKAEDDRATRVAQQFAATMPGMVKYTTEALFTDLWLRPDLAPRDRSLVTVTALVASGQVAQIPYHLGRAMDNGLTQTQASEVLTHLAFYVGWPNVFSAMPVAKDVFAGRKPSADAKP